MHAAFAAVIALSAPTICIDPGHPSEVGRGTHGRRLTEIQAAWQVSKRLAHLLRQDGFKVALTKTKEGQFVRNRRRAEIANRCGAALMVRLHCDSDSRSGFTVYYPDRQGSDGSFRGPSLALLKQIHPAAVKFHALLASSLGVFLHDNGLRPDAATRVGSIHGALIGSIYSKVPVVLVEMCVLTHPSDEAKMVASKGQQQMASALATACEAVVKPARSIRR